MPAIPTILAALAEHGIRVYLDEAGSPYLTGNMQDAPLDLIALVRSQRRAVVRHLGGTVPPSARILRSDSGAILWAGDTDDVSSRFLDCCRELTGVPLLAQRLADDSEDRWLTFMEAGATRPEQPMPKPTPPPEEEIDMLAPLSPEIMAETYEDGLPTWQALEQQALLMKKLKVWNQQCLDRQNRQTALEKKQTKAKQSRRPRK